MIHGHGDDIGQYGETIRANFSSNVWYGGLNPGLVVHLKEKIDGITHYPDPAAETLQEAAAANYGLHPNQVLVTNGATEAIYLIAQAFRDRSATILLPTFSEYEDACCIHGLDITWVSWEEFTPATRFHTDLVFICNPNNPTGLTLSTGAAEHLFRNNPDCLFIIDESYIEFTSAAGSFLPELPAAPNLLILRSLTKSCRIPGLRIGFVIGSKDWIQTLLRQKMPWSVNSLAIEAGLYIFDHRQEFTLPLAQLLAATADWREQLQQATGWRIHDTNTHYFLVEMTAPAAVSFHDAPVLIARTSVPSLTAAALKQWLVREHGLLIRDASNFRGLTAYHFRVACQSPGHNQLLTDALRQCSQTGI